METKKYPIREALRNQGIKHEELAEKIGRSRQTLSRYLDQFERDGKVNDDTAQKELDSIMAKERQRLVESNDKEYNRERLEAKRRVLNETERKNTVELEKLLREILINHPDEPMYDWDGERVTLETLDLEKMRVNYGQNEKLISALTPLERSRWERICRDECDNFTKKIRNGRMHEAVVLEELWNTTEPKGKPVIYHDRFECAISAEEAGGKLYDFECDTFCMCSGSTARIYTEDLRPPYFEHNVEFEVIAMVEVITEKGLYYMDSVKLEAPGYPGRFVGQIDNLIPGYKYVYSLSITAGDYDDVNELEYTLLEGYHASSHPLK